MVKSYCTFFVNGTFFGIDLLRVQEIIPQQATVPVPLAPRTVAGLVNLRGHLLVAVDLAAWLELPPGDTPRTRHIVLRTSSDPVCLVVDRVWDVVELDDALLQPPPQGLAGAAREVTRGAFRMDDRLLLLLDLSNTEFN